MKVIAFLGRGRRLCVAKNETKIQRRKSIDVTPLVLYAVSFQDNVDRATVPVNHAYTDARTVRNVIGEDGDGVEWKLDLQNCTF